jgi:DNA-binding winged helix-turn-helix (wHTH) protein/tetratricopeptide (TPR) repeat protein
MAAGAPTGAIEGGLSLTPVVLAHEESFKIGDAEFRPATREVIRDGKVQVIEPRVMQLLVALHRAKGGVVSKDDLGHLIWEGRIVGEDAINRVVSRLRAVAEKQAAGQFRVETITKVGYRLVPRAAEQGTSAASEPALSWHLNRRDLLVGGGAAGVLFAGGAIWAIAGRNRLPAGAQALVDSARNGMYSGTIEETANAIGALRQASQIAPSSALVWGQLGYAYMRESLLAPARDRADLRTRANAAVQRALSLDPRQADARAAQIAGMRIFRNWLAVERAARAGLRDHPDNVGLLQVLGNVLMQGGRSADALPFIEGAIGQRPEVGHLRVGRCFALWNLGRFDEADVAIAETLARWPRFFAIWFVAVYYRLYGGKPAEAAAMAADIANRPVGIPEWNFALVEQQAEALASQDPGKIHGAIQASLETAHRGTGFAENAANFSSFAGDLDSAYAALGALYFNRGFAMPDAYFAPEQGVYSGNDRHTFNLFMWPARALRRDRRFAALTRELGLDAYWAATNSRSLVTP